MEVLDGHQGHPLSRRDTSRTDVGDYEAVREVYQAMIIWNGLRFGHIQSSPGDGSVGESIGQSFMVYKTAAGNIHQSRSGFHPFEDTCVDEMVGIDGEWTGEDDVIRLVDETLKRSIDDSKSGLGVRFPRRSGVEHPHRVAPCSPCNRLADTPETDDPERRSP